MGYPANVSTVTVTGTWTYSDGGSTVPTGYVTFQPNTVLQDAGTSQIIDVKPLTATLDGSGHISVTLMNTSDVDVAPTGWAYTVTEHVAGNQRQYDVFITGTTVDLSALAPVSSTPQFGYVLTTSSWVDQRGRSTAAGKNLSAITAGGAGDTLPLDVVNFVHA